jgi:hypothetical protein
LGKSLQAAKTEGKIVVGIPARPELRKQLEAVLAKDLEHSVENGQIQLFRYRAIVFKLAAIFLIIEKQNMVIAIIPSRSRG